jgi:hypothetical protein
MRCRLSLTIWFVEPPGVRRGEDFDRYLRKKRQSVKGACSAGAGSWHREPRARIFRALC